MKRDGHNRRILPALEKSKVIVIYYKCDRGRLATVCVRNTQNFKDRSSWSVLIFMLTRVERRVAIMSVEVETMMFTGRERPWHGLGTQVEEATDSREALIAAGLDWDVV